MITDVHTHRPDAADAIISVSPGMAMRPGLAYSVGVHPWDAHAFPDSRLGELERQLQQPQVVAVGETGLDARHPGMERQLQLFERHIQLAEAFGKPLVIHCVGAWHHLLRLRREHPGGPAWIVHGFRGKPALARQLLDAGMFLSFGERFNPASVAITPADRLLVETDTSTLPIAAIAARLASCSQR